jgi:hypothetical protein
VAGHLAGGGHAGQQHGHRQDQGQDIGYLVEVEEGHQPKRGPGVDEEVQLLEDVNQNEDDQEGRQRHQQGLAEFGHQVAV